MAAIFGGVAALTIGLSDLFGRRILSSSSATTVGVSMHGFGAITAFVTVVLRQNAMHWPDFGRGGLSGLGMAIGLAGYYLGVSKSTSAVVAPVVAVLASVVPFVVAVTTGADAGPLAFVGAAIAIGGIVVLSTGGDATMGVRHGLTWGLVSGTGYGFAQSMLLFTTGASGSWPAVGQRGAGFVVLSLVALKMGHRLLPAPGRRVDGVMAGVCGGVTAIFVLLALQDGPTVGTVMIAMFPAVSVAVGRIFFGDAMRTAQGVGLAMALAGVTLVIVA